MSSTTIKVSRDLRDRLKQQAADENRTLGEHLDFLASLADRRRRFATLRKEIDATPSQLMESYHEETEWWEPAQDG